MFHILFEIVQALQTSTLQVLELNSVFFRVELLDTFLLSTTFCNSESALLRNSLDPAENEQESLMYPKSTFLASPRKYLLVCVHVGLILITFPPNLFKMQLAR